MADTSTTAMFTCTMLHELILTPMTSIVAVITLIISSFVYARYRCVWKTMIVITVILLAGAFIYWMSVKVLENWTLAVGSVVVVTGWTYAKNIGTFIGVITKWKTGITQLRRLLCWMGFCEGDGPEDSRQIMTGNQPGASAMDTNGGKVIMEQLYRSTRVLSKDKMVSLTVKLEVRSEEAEAALEDKSKIYQDVRPQMLVDMFKDCGIGKKLIEALKSSALQQRDSNTKILTASCEGQVTEEQLVNIACKFPHASYESFCIKLGFGVSLANSVLVHHLVDRGQALMDILMAWKNRTGGHRTDLARYLFEADVGDLAKILYS